MFCFKNSNLPNFKYGLIESDSAGIGTLNFYKPFETIPNIILTVSDANNKDILVGAYVTSVTTDGFTYKIKYLNTSSGKADNATGQDLYWLAIG